MCELLGMSIAITYFLHKDGHNIYVVHIQGWGKQEYDQYAFGKKEYDK